MDKVGQILIQRFNLQQNISIRPNKHKNKTKQKQKQNKQKTSMFPVACAHCILATKFSRSFLFK